MVIISSSANTPFTIPAAQETN